MKVNYTQQSLQELRSLTKKYPYQSILLHISIALADYPSIDTLSDKEFIHALRKYSCEKDLDFSAHVENDNELDKILSAGMNLDSILDDEEEF